MTVVVSITKQAERALRRMPVHIVVKLMGRVAAVEGLGLQEVRKLSGYHDEPLKGQRKRQRSIRLSGSYRVIYVTTIEQDEGERITMVSIEEVSKHEY